MKSQMSDRAPSNSTFRGGSWERRRFASKLWLSPRKRHLDGSCEKTKRIATVEKGELNWMSISSAIELDVTRCGFSTKSARDEMRHVIGSSEPDVIIGSDRDQSRGCRRKDKDHIEFLCELCEAQVAHGRYFVHELTSEVNSRMRCMAKVMAMPGIRTAVTDLCTFGLAAGDEGGPRFVNVSVRTITNARRVGVRLQKNDGACLGKPMLARIKHSRRANELDHRFAKSLKQ